MISYTLEFIKFPEIKLDHLNPLDAAIGLHPRSAAVHRRQGITSPPRNLRQMI